MDTHRLPTNLDSLRRTLRDRGLRSTSARLDVIKALAIATGPLSHAEVYDGLSDRGYDRATVYRNLIDLTEHGLVSRTDHGDHVWRFELYNLAERDQRASADHEGDPHGAEKHGPKHGPGHPHFICTDCGTVECLDGDDVTVSLKARKVKVEEVVVKGTCARCSTD